MSPNADELLQRIAAAEHELDQAITAWRVDAREHVRARVAGLSAQVVAQQRRLRRGLAEHLASIGLLFWLTAPFIYALIVPLLLTDLLATLYQRMCFPVYRIGLVRRAEFVVLDRHRLGYLNALEKLNCLYCSYANGVIAYTREIASRTEQFFCPIKHAIPVAGPHRRYTRFVDYGDAAGYRARLAALRKTAGDP